jgi:hypothetical protein
MRSPERVK